MTNWGWIGEDDILVDLEMNNWGAKLRMNLMKMTIRRTRRWTSGDDNLRMNRWRWWLGGPVEDRWGDELVEKLEVKQWEMNWWRTRDEAMDAGGERGDVVAIRQYCGGVWQWPIFLYSCSVFCSLMGRCVTYFFTTTTGFFTTWSCSVPPRYKTKKEREPER